MTTKLLLVEDNEMNYEMLSRRLERAGFQVTLAVNGQQGIDKARSERPDIILMDMSLPVIDGWTATRTLKAAPETADIPVIALTAHAREEDKRKCFDAGCDDFQSKPINFRVLLQKIEALTPR